MYKKANYYIGLFGFILFSILSSNTYASTSCETVNIGTSKVLGSKQSHCVILPIYTNEPLVIVQYEVSNLSYNRFKVNVTNSTNNNAAVKESFTSSGSVAINRSFEAASMGNVVLKIKPTSTNRKSNVKIMYGEIDGIYTVFIHNKNVATATIPPIDSGGCNIRENICNEPKSIPIQTTALFHNKFFTGDTVLSNAQSGGAPVCSINNSSPNMPDLFDMNASLKKAEEFKNKMNLLNSTINSYGDMFERKSLPHLKTAIKYSWAVSLMNDGQPLDLKAHFGTGAQFENFGNFHYGAFLKAAGFETTEILSGASTNQAWKDEGKSWSGAWAGMKGWFSQSADHPHDTIQVSRGLKYTTEVYFNDPNRNSISDSCDISNGLSKGRTTQGSVAGGGSSSGSSGGSSGGSGGIFTVHSCELWSFPNGNGGQYYVYRNCRYYYSTP